MKLFFRVALPLLLTASLTVGSAQPKVSPQMKLEKRQSGAVPRHVLEVYNHVVDFGRAPEGYVGGAPWYNREHRLPRGRYREYDVHPKKKGVSRGPERIVVDTDTNRGWYTADHYRTLSPIPPIHLKRRPEAKPRDHLH
ncbi:MAG: ribonuclease domain-containing protein [Bacteroidota bacterium]